MESGHTVEMTLGEIRGFLADAGTLLDATFRRPRREHVMSPGGVPYTYFLNENPPGGNPSPKSRM